MELQGSDLSNVFHPMHFKNTQIEYLSACSYRKIPLNYLGVQFNDYKFIWDFPNGKQFLFNLKTDPKELDDLSMKKVKMNNRLSSMLFYPS